MLEKWQVPRKYYDMIEDLSHTKEEGYFIYLKPGYVNDVTGSRNIHYNLVRNAGSGKKAYTGMPGIMRAVLHAYGLYKRHPVAVIIISVLEVFALRGA